MQELQFTQEIKDNWIKNLESGKYKQGYAFLYNQKRNSHCCIGVLAMCTPGLDINDDINDTPSNPYYFLNQTIGAEKTNQLWRANDLQDYDSPKRDPNYKDDYSNVIDIIKGLPTVN